VTAKWVRLGVPGSGGFRRSSRARAWARLLLSIQKPNARLRVRRNPPEPTEPTGTHLRNRRYKRERGA